MDKKKSSSGQYKAWIALAALTASVIWDAVGTFLNNRKTKRKNISSTQSQSQAQPTEETSTASATPKRTSTNTPTNTQIDAQSNTQASTQTSTQTKINVPQSNTYLKNESHPYSRPTYQPYFSPTKRVTDYETLLQGTRVMDLPTNPNFDHFDSLNDLYDEQVDDE